MPNKLLAGVYRASEYLDKQAIREKEKKKERFLTVLPTYIENQLSGVEDEKTLLQTVPKLSAELYQYGPEIGSAASQILGNLAQTKYRELALSKQDKQLGDTLEIYGETYKGLTFDYGGNQNATMGDILDDLRTKGYDSETIGSQIGNILKSTAFQETGQVTEKGGKTFYNEYSISPKGTIKAGTSFQINEDAQGKRTMDDLSTPNIKEELPITEEALKYYGEKADYDRKLQAQLNMTLTRDQIARQKKIADYKLKIEAQQYYDRTNNDPIYAEFDPETFQTSYYKKKTPETVGALPRIEGREEVTDLSVIEQVGQQGRTERGLTPAQIDQDAQNVNRILKSMGEQIIAQKVPEPGFGWTGGYEEEDLGRINPLTEQVFYERAKIEEVVKKNPEHKITYLGIEMRLIDVWNIFLDLETKSQISTAGVTPKRVKGDYDKVVVP